MPVLHSHQCLCVTAKVPIPMVLVRNTGALGFVTSKVSYLLLLLRIMYSF